MPHECEYWVCQMAGKYPVRLLMKCDDKVIAERFVEHFKVMLNDENVQVLSIGLGDK